MTMLHQVRRAALKLGLDVHRAEDRSPGPLLRRRGVDLVLDVGANRGQYGEQLRRGGYRAGICSFEPLPQAFELLARRTARDAGWQARNEALGPQDGSIALNVAGNEGGASSSVLPMLPRHEQAAPDASYVGKIQVPMHRLDTIWAEVVPPGARTFVKLDVQGYEGAVLDGAADHIAEVVGLQLEISLVPVYEGALALREVLDRTEMLGMVLADVDPGFRDPNTGELLQMDGIFLRPDPRC